MAGHRNARPTSRSTWCRTDTCRVRLLWTSVQEERPQYAERFTWRLPEYAVADAGQDLDPHVGADHDRVGESRRTDGRRHRIVLAREDQRRAADGTGVVGRVYRPASAPPEVFLDLVADPGPLPADRRVTAV